VCVVVGGEGVLNSAVDHILQKFYTLFLTRFRTYKKLLHHPKQMTNEDDIKGLVSLKFLRSWLQWSREQHEVHRWVFFRSCRLLYKILRGTTSLVKIQKSKVTNSSSCLNYRRPSDKYRIPSWGSSLTSRPFFIWREKRQSSQGLQDFSSAGISLSWGGRRGASSQTIESAFKCNLKRCKRTVETWKST